MESLKRTHSRATRTPLASPLRRESTEGVVDGGGRKIDRENNDKRLHDRNVSQRSDSGGGSGRGSSIRAVGQESCTKAGPDVVQADGGSGGCGGASRQRRGGGAREVEEVEELSFERTGHRCTDGSSLRLLKPDRTLKAEGSEEREKTGSCSVVVEEVC